MIVAEVWYRLWLLCRFARKIEGFYRGVGRILSTGGGFCSIGKKCFYWLSVSQRGALKADGIYLGPFGHAMVLSLFLEGKYMAIEWDFLVKICWGFSGIGALLPNPSSVTSLDLWRLGAKLSQVPIVEVPRSVTQCS